MHLLYVFILTNPKIHVKAFVLFKDEYELVFLARFANIGAFLL